MAVTVVLLLLLVLLVPVRLGQCFGRIERIHDGPTSCWLH